MFSSHLKEKKYFLLANYDRGQYYGVIKYKEWEAEEHIGCNLRIPSIEV